MHNGILANYSEFELYLQDKHFETIANKLDHFYLFDPCKAQNLAFGLFFNNYKTVGRSN